MRQACFFELKALLLKPHPSRRRLLQTHGGERIQSVERLPQIPREMGAQKTMQCCQYLSVSGHLCWRPHKSGLLEFACEARMPSFVSGLDIGKVSWTQSIKGPHSITRPCPQNRGSLHNATRSASMLCNASQCSAGRRTQLTQAQPRVRQERI